MNKLFDLKLDTALSVLLASVALMLVGWGATYLIVVALKPIAAEFGWPRAVPSLALSLQFVGSGFGGLVMGYVFDRFGMGKPALVGTLMIGVGAIAASMISTAWQLQLIYGLMIGLFGVGSLSAPLMANIIRWYDHRRGMAVGVVASGQTAAGIVWPFALGPAIAEFGWRDTFFWFGVLALCLMLPLCLVVGRRFPGATESAGRAADNTNGEKRRKMILVPSRPLAKRKMQILLCAAIFGCCVAMSLPLSHIVSYATDLGFPLARAVEVISLMLLTAFLTRALMVGFLADRMGGLRALLGFSALQAASLAAMTAVDGLAALYVAAALFGFGYGGIFPVYAVIVREHMPALEAGWRTGLVFMFGAAAMGFGSWLGGYLFDQTGTYVPAFLVGVGFNVANIVVVLALILLTGRVITQPAEA